MLKVFRDNLKYLSWVLWGVILVFILFVFVDFGGGVPGPVQQTASAAQVGGDEISYGEFQRAYRQTEDAYREAYGGQFTPELARQLQLPLQVLETLVQQRILLAEADRMGLTVSDAALQKELLKIPIFLDEQGNFVGTERYRQLVRSVGYASPEGLEESIRTQMLLDKLNQVMADNVIVSDSDVERAYREQAERARIRYVKLPISDFREEVELTAEEVETFFTENIEEFRLPERRAVDYLMVDVNAIRQGLEVSEEELRAYYTEHAAEYESEEQVRARQILLQVNDQRTADQARQELEALRARIEAGEDFAELARQLSEDPVSSQQGGDLGLFGRGQILEEVETAAFGASPGELVGPIQSGFGLHLLEVMEHLPGGLPNFAEMQETLSRRLLAERARESGDAQAAELAERIAKENLLDQASFQQLAEGNDAFSFQSTPAFGRSDNVPGIGRSTPFSLAAFDLQEGEASEPVRIGSGWAILRLSEVEAPRLPEVAEVEAEVRTRLRDLRAEEGARARFAEAHARVASGAALDTVAAELGATVEETTEFAAGGSVGDLGANVEISAAALALEQGDVGQPILAGTDLVLFQVSERKHFDPMEFAAGQEETRAELANERLNQMIASLVAERRVELEVTYDPNLTANLGLDQG